MSVRRGQLVLLGGAALLMACNRAPPPEPVLSEAPEPATQTACVLPAERPADLSIQATQTTVPRGGVPQTHARLLAAACPPTERTCVAATPERLDALYQRLLASDFGSLGTEDGGRASPHYGSRTISLSWGEGHSCTVTDASHRALPRTKSLTLRELVSEILSAS